MLIITCVGGFAGYMGLDEQKYYKEEVDVLIKQGMLNLEEKPSC